MSGRSIEKGDEVVPPHSRRSHHEALGYFCTTPNDTCDEDCVGGIVRCTYDIDEKRWVWAISPDVRGARPAPAPSTVPASATSTWPRERRLLRD